MRKQIIKIKGKFTLEGDIPGLNLMTKDFEEVTLELIHNPVVIIIEMIGCVPCKK